MRIRQPGGRRQRCPGGEPLDAQARERLNCKVSALALEPPLADASGGFFVARREMARELRNHAR